jgi:hypothetical protein
MTEREIQNAFARRRTAWGLLLPNYTPGDWYECDLFAVTKAGYLVEHEIKLTVADFKADEKKGRPARRYARASARNPIVETKHERLAARDESGPSRFNYIVPRGLVSVDDVPEWAGLIYADVHLDYPSKGRRWIWFEDVKAAPRLHKVKVTEAVMKHAKGVCYYRYWNERLRGVA